MTRHPAWILPVNTSCKRDLGVQVQHHVQIGCPGRHPEPARGGPRRVRAPPGWRIQRSCPRPLAAGDGNDAGIEPAVGLPGDGCRGDSLKGTTRSSLDFQWALPVVHPRVGQVAPSGWGVQGPNSKLFSPALTCCRVVLRYCTRLRPASLALYSSASARSIHRLVVLRIHCNGKGTANADRDVQRQRGRYAPAWSDGAAHALGDHAAKAKLACGQDDGELSPP